MPRVEAGERLPPGDATALGARVRSYREARHLTVRGLAARTSLSPSFVSQFERGRTNASIGVLSRIADALGLSTADLFETTEVTRHRLLRRADRPRLATGSGTRKYLISPRPSPYVEVYTAELDPAGTTSEEPYVHGSSREILLVLRGRLRCWVGDESFDMAEGDSVEYPTDVPHRAENPGDEPAEVLWVISPPSSH